MVVHGFAAVVLGVSLLASPPELGVGDPAPDLAIANWVKGEAVDLAKLKGKKVAVVEFWATWCGPCRTSIPHLTELQKEFADKDVVVIGVSSGEELETVKEFVGDWGEKMDYIVAQDDERKTFDAWMKAAGENGIPTAFVVDKEGRVAWIGHPMSGLDGAIEAVLAGTHSIDEEIERRKEKKESQKELMAAQERQMEMQQHFAELVHEGKLEKAAGVARKIFKENSDNATQLNNFAWVLLTEEPCKGHFDKIALEMATRSNELTEGKVWYILDTLALAKFQNGFPEEAVDLETKSIRLARKASVAEQQMASLESALSRFSAHQKKRKFY